MTYNLTNVTDSLSIVDYHIAVDQLVGGLYTVLGLFTLFIILMIAMKNYDTATAFLVSAFIVAIVGAILVFVGVLSWQLFGIIFVLLIIGVIINVWKSE